MKKLSRLNTFSIGSTFLLASFAASPVFAIDEKMIGSWSTSAQCEDDMTIHIGRNGFSGVDHGCTFVRIKPEKGGWRVTLKCAGEGEDYSMDVNWRLLKNGRLRQSAAGRRTIEMRRC